jgi:hypothetical protein
VPVLETESVFALIGVMLWLFVCTDKQMTFRSG